MKIIKIQGGLGNQMFQYAYGRGLELLGKKVLFDVSFFYGNKSKKEVSRVFKINKFNLLTKCKFSKERRATSDYFGKIKTIFGLKNEKYYQSEGYFAKIKDDIRREFVLKNRLSNTAENFLEKILNFNSVSIHIRRGDYVLNEKTKSYHGVCGLEYYTKAIEQIRLKVLDPVFFIFSDDIEWAKQNLVNDKFVYVSQDGIEDIEEMVLMSKCKHNIIANSTFSWWAAWLNQNAAKIVVAPSRWFASPDIDTSDLLPSNWIKI